MSLTNPQPELVKAMLVDFFERVLKRKSVVHQCAQMLAVSSARPVVGVEARSCHVRRADRLYLLYALESGLAEQLVEVNCEELSIWCCNNLIDAEIPVPPPFHEKTKLKC